MIIVPLSRYYCVSTSYIRLLSNLSILECTHIKVKLLVKSSALRYEHRTHISPFPELPTRQSSPLVYHHTTELPRVSYYLIWNFQMCKRYHICHATFRVRSVIILWCWKFEMPNSEALRRRVGTWMSWFYNLSSVEMQSNAFSFCADYICPGAGVWKYSSQFLQTWSRFQRFPFNTLFLCFVTKCCSLFRLYTFYDGRWQINLFPRKDFFELLTLYMTQVHSPQKENYQIRDHKIILLCVGVCRMKIKCFFLNS